MSTLTSTNRSIFTFSALDSSLHLCPSFQCHSKIAQWNENVKFAVRAAKKKNFFLLVSIRMKILWGWREMLLSKEPELPFDEFFFLVRRNNITNFIYKKNVSNFFHSLWWFCEFQLKHFGRFNDVIIETGSKNMLKAFILNWNWQTHQNLLQNL